MATTRGRDSGASAGGKRTGELAELQRALIRLSGQQGAQAATEKREHFRKVINNMTIGIDMSSLFTQMVLACTNEDLVLKKMLYQYIQVYASSHPDNVLLTINTLQKDCQDLDPKLRGLALRTLCSLRVANLLEYLIKPLKSGLQDHEAYVRRTAVMGVFKVYHLDPKVVENQGFADKLHAMLVGDSDAQVISNCLEALVGMEGVQKLCKKEVVYHLLNLLKQFSEWAQCQVMDFVSHYRPEDETEVFEIMNVLEDCMTQSNSAIVLAVCKLYLHITLSMPATHQQVLERIKSPLMTLLGHDCPEVAYPVLSHLHLLISRAPVLFAHDFKDFYCKYSEPTYIKKLKMEILTEIADTTTAYEICTELSEYVNYGEVAVAREAVRSVGRIALQVPDVPGICDRLLSFLNTNLPHVAAETLVIIKDLLRRYPERAEECISATTGMWPSDISEPAARAAFVWLLGEHGKSIQDAPYLLEPLVESFADQATPVQLALLTACMKLFFQRPPESQRLLGLALKQGVSGGDQDVQDRAMMYYRLLQHSSEAAQRVVCPTIPVVAAFAEEQSAELKDRVFDEFNTLSVIFRSPAATFLDKDANSKVAEEEIASAATTSMPQSQVAADDADDELLGDLLNDSVTGQTDDGLTAPEPSSQPQDLVSLLDVGDVFGGTVAVPQAPSLLLDPNPVLEPAAFQGKWGKLAPAATSVDSLTPEAIACIGAGRLPDHMRSHQMPCMAHGGASPSFKFYFYAKLMGTESYFLVEANVRTDARTLGLTIKADDPSSVAFFLQKFQAAVSCA